MAASRTAVRDVQRGDVAIEGAARSLQRAVVDEAVADGDGNVVDLGEQHPSIVPGTREVDETEAGRSVFQRLGAVINRVLDYAFVGSSMVFGPLGSKEVWPRVMTTVLGDEGARLLRGKLVCNRPAWRTRGEAQALLLLARGADRLDDLLMKRELRRRR